MQATQSRMYMGAADMVIKELTIEDINAVLLKIQKEIELLRKQINEMRG